MKNENKIKEYHIELYSRTITRSKKWPKIERNYLKN